jgi:hypothetical protein
MQLYELKAELERRKPAEYVRKMTEPATRKPDKRGAEADNPRGMGGFGGMPVGGGFGGPGS